MIHQAKGREVDIIGIGKVGSKIIEKGGFHISHVVFKSVPINHQSDVSLVKSVVPYKCNGTRTVVKYSK